MFFELIGAPELGHQFRQPYYFDDEKRQLFPQLDGLLTTRTTAEWCQVFGAANIRHAPVRTHADVVADPAVWANGYLQNVSTPAGEVAVVASPVRFSGTPAHPGAIAPELGQHTEEVLLELGYSWEQIAALSSEGVI
jgi:crotonobetainyl-CoA:carnitine CoA-transferase CaiB-like acyl-CoA transferase